jgi:hypothetical protein
MTPNPRTKRRIFSPPVLSRIMELVDQGVSPSKIADEIGCSIGSLRVRCSQHGISLRRPALAGEERPARLVVRISRSAALALQRQAQNDELSATQLAALLLEAVVRDNLYEAVIDRTRHETVNVASAGENRSKVGGEKIPISKRSLGRGERSS